MTIQFSNVKNERPRGAKGQEELKYVEVSKIGQISEGKKRISRKNLYKIQFL